MKKETEFYQQAESQKQRSMGNVSSEENRLNNQWKLIDVYFNFAAVRKILSGSAGWTSDSLCKGPPGRPLARGHPPEPIAVSRSSPLSACRGEPPEFIEGVPELIEAWPEFIEGQTGVSKKPLSLITTNFYKQNMNDKQILFFKNLLIFKIMKKQILFLAFLITVLFTGMKSYGQNAEVPYLDGAPTCTSAVTLGCADGDELHPMPGVTYNYAVTASSSNVVHWFVTDDADVWLAGAIAAAVDPDGGTGSYILDAEDGVYNQGTSAATPNTLLDIDISWKSFDGTTNQVILVAYVTDAAGCTDNIQVWRIEPQYNFTLDIAGLLDAGTAGDEECVSPIVSANYDGTNLTMDHGVNYVFFSVNAANWQTEWKPTFTIDPSTTATIASSVVGVQWAYPNESFGASPVWHDATDNVQASHYEGTESVNGFVGSAGACIVLKVEVDHTTATVQNELLADQTVIIGVDGEMIDPQTGTYTSTYLDKDEGAAPTDPCVTNHTDEGTYTITARPTIIESNPTTVDGPFEPKD